MAKRTPKDPFFGPWLKVERADHHILQLEAIFRASVGEHMERVRRGRNKRVPAWGYGSSLPRHTPTLIGDAVHNLRAALDHAWCELIQANGQTPGSQSYFPFHPEIDQLKSTLEGQEQQTDAKKPPLPKSSVVRCIIDEIQPAKDGAGKRLYAIHTLDRADKHSVLLPASSAVQVGDITVQNPDGSVGGLFGGITFVKENANEDSGDFIRLTGHGFDAKLAGDPQSAFDIRFGDGTDLAGESIITTLKQLSNLVGETLARLEKA